MHRRILGSIRRSEGQNVKEKSGPVGDSPEAIITRGVRLFCESARSDNSGDEVLHLPPIVDAAESSPAAATQAATEIRKCLSSKNYQRPYVQYNAIMLVRILSDNPGKSFTRNLDAKFVATTKDLLRDGRDMSVQQILRETLDSFEVTKAGDETLIPLLQMWKKEKEKLERTMRLTTGPRLAPPMNQQPQDQQNYFARNHHARGLPAPAELSQRVEEAKTSAKLLNQVVQSTPTNEILHNDLIKEFADRCRSASRSMQLYIHSDSPAPDEDTLLTLIETNDQLAHAMSRHQRALLQARRLTGASSSPAPGSHGLQNGGGTQAPGISSPTSNGYDAPAGPPPGRRPIPAATSNPFSDENESAGPGPGSDLQPALVPMNYGMPPAGVATPSSQNLSSNGLVNETASAAPSQPQQRELERDPAPVKPKYRF